MIMNIVERKKMISVQFDNILELMDYKPTLNLKDFEYSMDGRTSYDKFGSTNVTAKDVINHALLGDSKLYENQLKNKVRWLDTESGYYTTDYQQQIKVVKRKVKYTDFGDEIDIHKVYRGEIGTAWRKTERVEIDSKLHLVTLLVDIGGHWGQDADDSLWRASVVVKIVRDLENAGKSVRVVVGTVSENVTRSNKMVATSIVVKEYNASLPLERLAAMCNLGFRRTAGFACNYCVEEELHDGLGQPTNISHSNLPWQLKDEEDAGHTKFVIIGRASSSYQAKDKLQEAYDQMKSFSD